MTITIDLAPAVETNLRQRAAQAGVAAEDYLKDMIEKQLTSSSPSQPLVQRSAPQDAWEELLEKTPYIPNTGHEIPLEAMSRQDFYDERE
ncbi:MAG: hypothetical protein ABIY70_25140 [Capsulimonas sp.]|uniref:hypothetical protein n=1 Tax=Capsulimonas sp. TaxID=2494211 RepID=UPI003262F933